MNVWLRWRVDINNSNKKLCWLCRIVKVDMELMQRVTYRWRRRVNSARSSTNCHNLLLISESWESWRVSLTHRLTHLRSQPKDANLVWWTLCDFILKGTPSLFLSFQSHHPIVSQLERGRLFRVVVKRSESEADRRAGVLFSVHLLRGFFLFLFDVPVRGRWWARNGEFWREFEEKPGFPSARKQRCVRLFYALQDPRVSLTCFWKKKKEIKWYFTWTTCWSISLITS